MTSAFSAAPAGFDQLSTSFNGTASDEAFFPLFERDDNGGRGRGTFFGPLGRGPGFGMGFMGGGLGSSFLGDGIGFFLLHDSDDCTFDATSGLRSCTATKRDGLTISRTLKFTTAAGVAEQKFDANTDAVMTTTSVKGTITRRDSSTSTVDESSSATVSGLSAASTARVVNALSAGNESTTGTSKQGAFTAVRTAGDTVTGLTFNNPGKSSGPFFPTAGSVVRSMQVTVTLDGQSPAKSLRREQITYDGSATAKVVITHDATTQNCTQPLPFGRLTCQ